MPKFAHNTTVAVQQSQAEAVKILGRYGATGYMCGQLPNGMNFIAFEYKQMPVRLEIPPTHHDASGRSMTPDASAQELRRRWRVLVLWLKGQLEAIDNDFLSPMQAFMPHLQLRDGRTVSEAAQEDPKFIGQFGGGMLPPALNAPEVG